MNRAKNGNGSLGYFLRTFYSSNYIWWCEWSTAGFVRQDGVWSTANKSIVSIFRLK